MRAYIAEFLQVQLSPYKKSNYVRPPRPKEQGMLRATRLFFEISEIFEALLPRFPWSARLKLCFRLSQNSHQCVIDLEKREKWARVQFIPNLKVRVIRDPPALPKW